MLAHAKTPKPSSSWVWRAPWQAASGPGEPLNLPRALEKEALRHGFYEDLEGRPAQSPLSLWSGRFSSSSTVPSMIVIGLQGSQTPRHEPTPESFVFGPRRSLRLHFPHRLQSAPWPKRPSHFHPLTARPVGPLAPVSSNEARCPPPDTHTGRQHMKENG